MSDSSCSHTLVCDILLRFPLPLLEQTRTCCACAPIADLPAWSRETAALLSFISMICIPRAVKTQAENVHVDSDFLEEIKFHPTSPNNL
eukprot:603126-Amphidinium_carterae.1